MSLVYEPLDPTKHLVGFIAMQTNPKVMSMIPKKTQTKDEAITYFHTLMEKVKTSNGNFTILACCIDDEFIGLGANIIDKRGIEIAYSLREEYWHRGWGTKICSDLIDLAQSKNENGLVIFGEANEDNLGSNKILAKFMTFKKKVFNEEDQAFDLIYVL